MESIKNKYIICKTFYGFEQILADELKSIGAKNIEILKRAVRIDYSKEMVYKCNVQLHLCLKVLVPIYEFLANTPEELYEAASTIDWEQFMTLDQKFGIDYNVQSQNFTHTQFAALKLKDAICDFFRAKYQERPNVDIENPDVQINLHIYQNKINLSLDSSGKSLHLRGFRKAQNEAPINEVLAAGLVVMSKWDKNSIFIDGMCGSGTILIEAANMALKRSPNLNREHFCFKNWLDFDAELFRKVLMKCKIEAKDELDFMIFGNDVSTKNMDIAKQNIYAANLSKYIEFTTQDFAEFYPDGTNGTVIINPPYGERMQIEQEQLESFYKQIGDTFKNNFKGFTCGIIASNMEALKKIHLNPSKKYDLLNGKIPCKFQIYEMYGGTKRKDKLAVE